MAMNEWLCTKVNSVVVVYFWSSWECGVTLHISTLARSGSTFLDLCIYGWNEPDWKLFVLDKNTWNHTSKFKQKINAQNHAIRIDYIKRKIDNTQGYSKFMFCGDRDEAINLMSGFSKISQKEYKNKYYWISKVIYRESCTKLIFQHIKQIACITNQTLSLKKKQNSLGLWNTDGSPNPGLKTKLNVYSEKK